MGKNIDDKKLKQNRKWKNWKRKFKKNYIGKKWKDEKIGKNNENKKF